MASCFKTQTLIWKVKVMSDVYSKSNGKKSKAGVDNFEKILDVCKQLESVELFKSIKRNYSFTVPNTIWPKFKADFLIDCWTDEKIAIYSSTSLRGDRFETACADLKALLLTNIELKAAFFVVPDEAQDSSTVGAISSINAKMRECPDIYPFTHLVRTSEFIEICENMLSAKDTTKYHDINSEFSWYLPNLYNNSVQKPQTLAQRGRKHARVGLMFEQELMDSLNDPFTLIACKANKLILPENKVFSTLIHEIFDACCRKENISIQEVTSVDCTNKIRLSSNGFAKTDLHISFYCKDGSTKYGNISCKLSNNKSVSCHEYPAKDFATVLTTDPGSRFRDIEEISFFTDMLGQFQAAGNWTKFEAGCTPRDFERYQEILDRNMSVLFDWAVAGKIPWKVISRDDPSVADLLLFARKTSPQKEECKEENPYYRLSVIENYKNELLSRPTKNKKGAPFAWTYPSKKRGKAIQLKLPLVYK